MKLIEMFSHWEKVRKDLLWTIDQFSKKDLWYAPFDDSWPVGQIMLHIADCEDNWLHGVVRGEFQPWIGYPLKEYPTKNAILERLNEARARTIPFLESVDESHLYEKFTIPNGDQFSLKWIIWYVLEHEIHHRGELSLILGTMGREGLDV